MLCLLDRDRFAEPLEPLCVLRSRAEPGGRLCQQSIGDCAALHPDMRRLWRACTWLLILLLESSSAAPRSRNINDAILPSQQVSLLSPDWKPCHIGACSF